MALTVLNKIKVKIEMRIIAVHICVPASLLSSFLTYFFTILNNLIFSRRQRSKTESLTCPADRQSLDPDRVSKLFNY